MYNKSSLLFRIKQIPKVHTMSTKKVLLLFVLVLIAVVECRKHKYLPRRCTLPKHHGGCRAAVRRFWYDMKLQKCLAFTWGGCGGNANKFETYEECYKKCVPNSLVYM